MTKKLYLMTGSADNVICFWKMFDMTISKDVKLPQELVESSTTNQICALYYPDPNMNELLLVFMSRGEVFCYNNQDNEFMKTRDSYEFAKLKPYSVVDY